MSLSGAKCSALLVLLSNVLFSWISGALLVLFGAVYLYDPSYLPFFHLLANGICPESTLIIFSLCIIGLGAFVITLGLFGCFGTLAENQCILKTYINFLIIVFLVEVGVAAGCLFLYLAFPSASEDLQSHLMTDFQQFYSTSPQYTDFTSAMDFAQSHLKCCGIYNYTDYEVTNWRTYNLDNSSLKVPASCCSSTRLPPKDVEDGTARPWMDDEESWMERCQSSNPMESDDYLYVQGCWTQLEQVFYQNTLFSCILFSSLAVVQLFGVALSIFLSRKMQRQRGMNPPNDQKVSEPLLL